MEVLLIVGFLLFSVYLIWKITKALFKTVLYTLIFLGSAYFAAPYVLGGDQLSLFERWTDKGTALMGDTINDAKDLTNDKVLDPLKDSVEPVRQLNDVLNSGKKNKKRGIEQ